MDAFKNPIDQFISELGGTSRVARAMDLRPSVVSTWRKTGRIPEWRIVPVVVFAQQSCVGVEVPSDFLVKFERFTAAQQATPTGQTDQASGEITA